MIGTVIFHWNGKLLPLLKNKELVDRLSIVLIYKNDEKPISILQLSSGIEKNQVFITLTFFKNIQ